MRVGDHLEKGEAAKLNKKLKADGKRGVDVEPFSFYLSAWEEDRHTIAQANIELDENLKITEELVNARRTGNFVLVNRVGGRLRRRQPEAARLGRRFARAVP